MKPRLTSMTAGLAIGITATVCAASAAGAYLYSLRHYRTQLETMRATALGQAELVRTGLEHEMSEADFGMVSQLIRAFASEPRVAGVMLLDRPGHVRHSGGRVSPDSELTIDSPTCQACHQRPPAQRTSSQAIEMNGGSIVRTVVPFRNRPECHRCHDPAHAINGVLVFDLDATAIRAAATRDLRWMVGASAVLALCLILSLALIVRQLVLRRLQQFETTARLIANGDLNRRVPESGSDTIAWLAREFNVMADSVTGLLEDVRSERERLETVINSIDDGVVVLDANRTVLAANDAFLRRRGGSRERTLGSACGDAGRYACSTADDCPAAVCLATREHQVRVCESRRHDGSIAWEEVHASPVAGHTDGAALVVEVWRDITERRAAEARLAESHRLASLGMLASGFSHEINTPLATVLTCVEGIGRDARVAGAPLDRARISETAAIAREQLLRCRGITQHFLRLSRGERTSGDLLDLRPILASAARLVQPTARSHGVTIALAPEPRDPAHVRADESDLQHTVINLLLNAIQASRSGSTVTLGLDPGDPIAIRVIDHGCGIAPEHQQRIFEPFFGLRPGGTGLGLFLALTFVRKWGGTIGVSTTPGGGATFEVRLPSIESAARKVAV